MLTDEQQLVWAALKGAPFHAHYMAQDIMAIKGRGKRFHQRIDQHLLTVMQLYTVDEVLRIVHTWLKVYQMPIDPGQLLSADRFYADYGHVVARGVKHLQPY